MSNLSSFVKRIRDIMRNDAGINGDAQRIEQIAWMLFLKVYDAKEQDWEISDDSYVSIIPDNCRWYNWAHDDHSGKAMTGDKLLDFVNNTLFPTLKGLNVTPETPIKKSIVRTTFEDANQYMKDGVLLRQVINIIDELDLSDYEESHAFGEIYESILRELQSAGSSGEFYTPRAVTDFMAKMINPQIGEKVADFACGTGGFLTSWLKELAPKIETTQDQEQYNDSIYGIEKKQFPYMLCITNMLLHDIDIPKVYHENSLIRDVLDYTENDQFDVILMNPPFGGNEKPEVKKHFPTDIASSETADLFMAVIMYRLKKNGRAAVILPDGFLFGNDSAKKSLKQKLLSEFNLHTIIRLPCSVFAPYTPKATNILFFERTHPTEETWVYRFDIPEELKHFSKLKPIKTEHFDKVVEWWHDRSAIQIDGVDKARKFTVKELTEMFQYDLDKCCSYPIDEEDEVLEPAEIITRFQTNRFVLNDKIDRVISDLQKAIEEPSYQPKIVFASGLIDQLVSITRSFPNRLQKAVLSEAMQGKLTSHYNNESAEVLAEEIKKHRSLLEKQGIAKKYKDTIIISSGEFPFDIPDYWLWTKIEAITYPVGNKNNQIQTKDVLAEGLFPVVSQGQNLIDGYSDDAERVISDLPLVMFGDHTRNVKYIDFEFVIGADGTKFHKCIDVNPRFVYYWMLYAAGTIRNRGYARHYGLIKEQYVPLPPIQEQERIVERLDILLKGLETL